MRLTECPPATSRARMDEALARLRDHARRFAGLWTSGPTTPRSAKAFSRSCTAALWGCSARAHRERRRQPQLDPRPFGKHDVDVARPRGRPCTESRASGAADDRALLVSSEEPP